MRWQHESAVTRRDDHLAQVRRLSIWIGTGAAGASFALIIALSSALPGHTVSTSTSGSTGQAGTGQPNTPAARQSSGGGKVSAPQQPPSNPVAPPVVSSGGS